MGRKPTEPEAMHELQQEMVQRAQQWDESAALAYGANLAVEHGAVQFRGRRRLAIADEIITVPILHVLALAGQIMVMMQLDTPEARLLRVSIGGAHVGEVVPGRS